MKTLAISLAATAAAFALAAPAQADSVNFSGYAHGSEAVTFTVPNQSTPGSLTMTVGAGGFATSLNGGPSFESYCVDLYQSIAFGTTYSGYTNVGSGHVFANSHAYTDLGRLYGLAGPIIDAVHEAAFQMAVWEIAYETSGAYGLGGGTASFSASAGATTLAAGWLSSINASSAHGPSISVLESRSQQDVIFAPVPEPETYLMMVVGLFGMTTVMRRRMRADSNRR